MTDSVRIGIFDSGMGGLSVLHEAMHRIPDAEFIFYADEDHVPYGEKTAEEITGYSEGIVNFMLEHGVDGIIIACNTATSVAARYLRDRYSIPIVGMEPAVKPALERADGRILVMATPVTIHEKKLHDLLERYDKAHAADLLEMPGLVTFAEREEFDTEAVRDYILSRLWGRDVSDYTALVLGCTHFNYFKPMLRDILGCRMYDGNVGTTRHLADVLGVVYSEDDTELCHRVSYFFSGREVRNREALEKIGRMHERLELVRGIN